MSTFKDLGQGFRFLMKGFSYLFKNPKLWPWAIIPTLLNLILIGVMLSLFIHYYGDMYGWLSAHLGNLDIENPSAWYWHILDGILWVLNILFQILIVLISLVLILILGYAASFIIAAPFNDQLSEKVETLVTGREPPPFTFKKFLSDIVRTVKIESIKALILIAIPIVLFVLNIIPVAGGPIYVVLTFIFGCWDLGFAYAELPLGRKVMPFRDRVQFGRKNKWALIGFGAGFIIPFFALLFAAPMVVGGTLLYIEKDYPGEYK